LKGDSKQVLLDVPTAVNKAAIMRESALKSVIFTGVPRVSHEVLILVSRKRVEKVLPLSSLTRLQRVLGRWFEKKKNRDINSFSPFRSSSPSLHSTKLSMKM
jgi:hypothetical protein